MFTLGNRNIVRRINLLLSFIFVLCVGCATTEKEIGIHPIEREKKAVTANSALSFKEKEEMQGVYTLLNAQGHVICEECNSSYLTKPLQSGVSIRFTQITNLTETTEKGKQQLTTVKKDTEITAKESSNIYKHIVYFHFDSSKLTEKAKEDLRNNIDLFISADNITIEGFTDKIGTKTYNDRLAVKRAKSVLEYLKKMGVRAEKISITGNGKCCYVSSKNSLNRRVEIKIAEI